MTDQIIFFLDRVSYPPELLKKLGQWASLDDSPFSPEDRVGLVTDAIAMAQAGFGRTSEFLSLTAQMLEEKNCMSMQVCINSDQTLTYFLPLLLGNRLCSPRDEQESQ
jgi:hypothetical protein